MNRPAPWRAIMATVVDRRPFTVGSARVDPVSRDATWPGGKERLQPQTLKVLMVLVSRKGDVVTRDELVQLCWDGRIVSDDVINRAILLLRHLAEHAGGFEIETVPRAGYRLCESATKTRLGRRGIIAASVAGLLVLAAIGLLRFEMQPVPPQVLTIAVLPFAADPGDPNARKLAAATREAVANTLAQGAYAVIAIDGPRQGARPAPDFLISAQFTGTPEKIVAAVRMEETAHHVVVFSHEFETSRDKAGDFPELIGGQVASQLSWTAPLIAIERRHPSDPAVIASLLQGSSAGLYGSGSMHDYETARRLAANNPNSPLAQTTFAFNTSFALDEIPRDQRGEAVRVARVAAERALTLAPEFGDNYVPWCLLHSEQRKTECEDRLRLGMRADPDAPFVSTFLVKLVLNPAGRNGEALELARAALAHDPYMPVKISAMLQMLEVNGRSGEADNLYRRSQRWWPNDGSINRSRAVGIAARGDFDELRRFAEMANPKRSNAVLNAVSGRSVPAVREACSSADAFDTRICIVALARFGDPDAAFSLADKFFPLRHGRTPSDDERIWLDDPIAADVSFLASPAAASLRADRRFLALADRVGLLAYWRSGRLPDFCSKTHEPVCAKITRN